MQGRPAAGGDHRHLAGLHGQKPFAGRIEEAFRRQLPLQLLQADIHISQPGRPQARYDELHLALGRVEVNIPFRQHLVPVLRADLRPEVGIPEHGAGNGGLRVLEAEIPVS